MIWLIGFFFCRSQRKTNSRIECCIYLNNVCTENRWFIFIFFNRRSRENEMIFNLNHEHIKLNLILRCRVSKIKSCNRFQLDTWLAFAHTKTKKNQRRRPLAEKPNSNWKTLTSLPSLISFTMKCRDVGLHGMMTSEFCVV